MRHINFDLQQLQAFIAVAERGSFRAAAEEIHLSPPAMSRRIEKLESIIGTRLLHRTTREVELTSVGRVFLERARAAIDDLESAMLGISDIATSRSGRVTVACVPSAAIYFLPQVISSFSAKYPAIRIRVIDESMNQTLQSVISGESDFGIGFMNTLMPDIKFENIHVDPFVVAMRRDHRLAHRKTVAWAEIAEERLISVARSSGNRQLLDDMLSKAGLNPNFAFEVSHIGTLLGMVEAGLSNLETSLSRPVFLFTYSVSDNDDVHQFPKQLACTATTNGIWSKVIDETPTTNETAVAGRQSSAHR